MPDLPTIVASNFRWVRKNTLEAIADVEIQKCRLKTRCTMWNSKNGSEWVAFPCREWLDCDGHRQFAVLLEFSDKDVERRFKDAALTAIHAFAAGSGA